MFYSFFVCSPGVFGVETDPVEIRELMEGDAVTLDTKCITKLQKDDEIEWKFGSDVIATIKANNPYCMTLMMQDLKTNYI